MKKMKFKLNLSGDSIKAMLANHSEKAVFGAIILVTLMLMHRGYQSRNPFSQERSPATLKSQADRARTAMREDAWADDEGPGGNPLPGTGVGSARTKDLQLMERLKAGMTEINLTGYPVPVPLSPLPLPLRTLRTDPGLFAVADLEVHAGNGPIAYSGGNRNEAGGGRKLTKAQQAAIPGFRPPGAADARGCRFAVVLAKIPVQAQAEEFDRCFKNSPQYDATRDVPKYVYYYVQRAEVQPDGSDGQWVPLHTGNAQTEAAGWVDNPDEVVAGKFLDKDPKADDRRDTGMSMNLLPLMIRDSSAWRKHSWFPLLEADEEPVADRPEPGEEPGDVPGVDAPGDMPGGDTPDLDRRPAHAARPAVAAEPDDAPAEFKMFRFFDLTVLPGRSYRYKVQLMFADPNDPRATDKRVEARFMDSSVIERLAGVTAGRHFRKSEWSEPSEAVGTPLDYHLLGGPVKAGRRIAVDRENSYQSEEPTGTVMTLLWDVAQATDLPGEKDVRRGSLLNYKTDVEAIEPVQLNLQTVPNFEFKTDTLVLDVAGGAKLPGRDIRDVLMGPGEMLLMDSGGNLVVRDEMGDAPAYFSHKYSEAAGEDTEPDPDFFEGEGETERDGPDEDRPDEDVPPEDFFNE